MTIPTLAIAKPAAHKRWQTFAYFTMFVAMGLGTTIVGPTLPSLAANVKTTVAGISILLTAQGLGWFAGSFVAGRYVDHRPGHPFLALVLLMMMFMLLAVPMATSLAVLALTFFLIGLSGGAIDVSGNTMLVWVHGDQVGPRMNAMHFFFGVGALISPAIVAQAIALTGGVRWAYWVIMILLLPAMLLLLRTASPVSPFHDKPAEAAHARPLLVALIAALFFLVTAAELSIGGWLYTYATALGLATAVTAGYLTSVFWAGLTVGRLITIPVAARVRPRYLLMVDITGMLVFLALLLIWPHAPGMVWVGAAGMGLSIANAFPTLMNMAEHNLPITAGTTRWFLASASLGSVIVPFIIGQLFEAAGPQMTVVSVFVCVALAALVLAAFLRTVRRPVMTGGATKSSQS